MSGLAHTEEQWALDATQYDVLVVGGGMVGAAAAVGLAQLGLSVALVESRRPEAYDDSQALDLRVSAISVASEQLLERLGAMEALKNMRSVAYKGLETWELDGFITRFHAEQLGASHLGHIVENRLIQLALWQRIDAMDNIHLFCPAGVSSFTRCESANGAAICARLDDGRSLQAHLVLGCDGANSRVRDWAGIGITGWDYAQSAMLINIETAEAEQDVTWQQFTPKGPRSLLPLPDNHASLVWYDDAHTIAALMQLNPKQLAEQIRSHFPARLDPNFSVLGRGSFSLTRRHAQRYYADNLVLLGDAAHTINPLAGQGVNLGFKDVDALISLVAEAMGDDKLWYDNQVLAKYQRARYRDNLLMMTAMDAFYAGFSNELPPLKLLRNAALRLANLDSPLKKRVLKYAMGLV
jgi:3-demethoxyubiquinol 3-hydroxylase